VDSLIESWEGSHDVSPEFENVYGAVGGSPKSLAGGLSYLQEDEDDFEGAVQPGAEIEHGMFDRGMMEELQILSGIEKKNGNGSLPY
jgi:hypothetical protein